MTAALPPRARLALVALGGAAVLLAGFGSVRALPRLTLANTGMRIDYPPSALLLALVAAAGAASVAYVLAARPLRVGAALVAAAFLLFALDRGSFRIEIDDAGVAVRRPLSSRRLAWREVTKVESGADSLTLVSGSGSPLILAAGSLTPEQRASLERAITRRLRDAPAASK
jgi:hypothetical protein